ncbi:type II toxin-antitoxin system HicB family antitoxin [Brevundimonas sp.]|uniref:type II toxin-antitoxin system HicB family antitoxin n=1 Tax=Brevundimonas sp. TaxID=1871086 RepID=UPI00289D83CA|nr:type II toxin-antitoxin system HicB family antitoxin [Brevundimonas sp.]
MACNERQALMSYIALIDGAPGGYGVSFPDLPGCVAMGDTLDEATKGAIESLREWVEETEAMGREIPAPRPVDQIVQDDEVREALSEGAILHSVVLIRNMGRKVKANMTLDSGVLAALDATADRLGTNRSSLVERMAQDHLAEYA